MIRICDKWPIRLCLRPQSVLGLTYGAQLELSRDSSNNKKDMYASISCMKTK